MSVDVCESRFKYEPDALREAVLHPRQLLVPSAAASGSPRVHKRQRVDDEGRKDAMDMKTEDPTNANTNGSLLPSRRGVELETTVERFLLRMYEAEAEVDAAETDDIVAASEDGGSDKQLLQGRVANDRRRWEVWLLGTLDGDDDADNGGDGSQPLHLSEAGDGGAVLLQRGLRAENLEFVEGEVRVLQDAAAGGDSETSSDAREGWAMEVRRWRWARA